MQDKDCFFKSSDSFQSMPYQKIQGRNDPSSPSIAGNIESFIQAHDPKYHEALRAMFSNIDYISWVHFYQRLQVAVESFNRQIPDHEDYITFIHTGKSNGWIFQLCCPFLKKAPVAVVETIMNYPESLPAVTELKNHPQVKHVVFFDDASYSGTQLYWNAQALGIDAFKELERTNYSISFVVPYLAAHAEALLRRLSEDPRMKLLNGSIWISAHQIIKKASKQIPPEFLVRLNELYFKNMIPQFKASALLAFLIILKNDNFKKTLYQHLNTAHFPEISKLDNLIQKSQRFKPKDIDRLINDDALIGECRELIKKIKEFLQSNNADFDCNGIKTTLLRFFLEMIKLGKDPLLLDSGQSNRMFKSRTLTLFDHKVADHLSTCPAFDSGLIYNDGEKTGKAVPIFNAIPPYKDGQQPNQSTKIVGPK